MNLWILVDKFSRIYYTGYSEELVMKMHEKLFSHIPNLKVISLKGDSNV